MKTNLTPSAALLARFLESQHPAAAMRLRRLDAIARERYEGGYLVETWIVIDGFDPITAAFTPPDLGPGLRAVADAIGAIVRERISRSGSLVAALTDTE